MRTGGISKVALMLGVVLALMASPAWADSIIGAVSATTNMGELFPLVDAINQTGLSAHYISGVTNFDVFVPTTTHDSEPGTDFVANVVAGTIIFNLGSVVSLDRTAIWDFGPLDGNPTFATKDISLLWSANGITYTSIGDFTLAQSVGFAQVIALGNIQAQYIRMDVKSNYGGASSALGEIAFAQAVPEPASFFLVVTGVVGLLGLSRKLN